MTTTFLYVLLDPETGDIRYVGKTDQPESRLRDHKTYLRPNRRGAWIASLKARNLFPKMEILFEVPVGEWEKYERAYIKIFREAGCRLVNGTDGGDAGPDNRGEKHPNFGKPLSYETRRRIGEANRGKIRSPEALRNQSEAHKGKPSTFKGCKHSESAKEKNRLSHLGRTHSEETKQEMSETRLRRHAKEREQTCH